jgi:hypothetical protein
VLPTDKFCLNCGQAQSQPVGPPILSQSPTIPPQQPTPPHPRPGTKSPTIAAILNLFIPGTGYIYTGFGRDTGELIFGGLVFLFYFIGFEVGVVGEALTTPVSASGPISPYASVLLLAFLLPFAFAYDGYRRARYNSS